MAEPPEPPKAEPRDALEERLTGLRADLARLVERIDVNITTPVPPGTIAAAPSVPKELQEADDLVHAIDEELGRIDELLARVAARERGIRIRGFVGVGEPYRSAEFTLYAREVAAKGGGVQVKLFFADEPPINAVPVPLPPGYQVEIDPRTGKRTVRKEDRT